MSNFLAVATVTSALRQLLLEWVQADVPGIEVTTVRPDVQGGATPARGVNVFLYRVSPNPQLRNFNRPERSAAGLLTALPQLALNLHYLLSFYGDEDLLEPQRVLGSTATALHTTPMITADRITAMLTGPNPPQFLAGSDLAEQVESVKFIPADLGLEELSKLWSVLFQTPYVLSMAFDASVVLLNPGLTPTPGLPVRRYQLGVVPLAEPVVDAVTAQAGEGVPITPESAVRAGGHALWRDPPATVDVLVGGQAVVPADVRATRMDLTLPAGLAAGVQSLLVRHSLVIGDSTPRAGLTSNLAAFVLHPVIVQDANGEYQVTVANVQGTGNEPRSAEITVGHSPAVHPDQTLTLELLRGAEVAHTFPSPPRTAGTGTTTFAVAGLQAGAYAFRIRVDGADSPLEIDPAGQPTAPVRTIP